MKKVLIIEGGGAFGIIPAYFLNQVEEAGLPWLEEVDCLSGCSIGGILSLCYAISLSPQTVFEEFLQKMPRCFEKRFFARFNPLACPTYTNDGIDAVLRTLLVEKRISDVRKRFPDLDIFIPALNLTDHRYKVFDNIDGQDGDELVYDVAGFTSGAPSYYSGREWKKKCMIDGGLIEVAPLITTVTGLHGKRGYELKDLDVLMLGCGVKVDERQLTTKEYNSLGLLGMATDVIVPYATKANQISSLYWGKNLGLGRFVYFNPIPTTGGMDSLEHMNAALQRCPDYAADFLAVWKSWIDG